MNESKKKSQYSKFRKQVMKGCPNMTPLKINYNYNQKKVFSGYLGVKIIGSLDFLSVFSLFLKLLPL